MQLSSILIWSSRIFLLILYSFFSPYLYSRNIRSCQTHIYNPLAIRFLGELFPCKGILQRKLVISSLWRVHNISQFPSTNVDSNYLSKFHRGSCQYHPPYINSLESLLVIMKRIPSHFKFSWHKWIHDNFRSIQFPNLDFIHTWIAIFGFSPYKTLKQFN